MKKVFLRSTSAQFAEIANTKSLSAALMGSSIWPPNGPILRNAPGGLCIGNVQSSPTSNQNTEVSTGASFLQGSHRAIAVHDACPLLQNNSDKSRQKRGPFLKHKDLYGI